MYAFALNRTKDREAAEDVTAETFFRALQHRSSFQWRGVPFSAWLFRIAANLAADQQQATGREAELTDETEILPVSWNDELAQAERRANLFTLVDRLPKDQRQVIVLRFVEERTGKEIAQAMGKSEGAVKQLQLRALRNLRAWAGETND